MEYLYYLLVIVSLIAVCLYLFRPAAPWREKPPKAAERSGFDEPKRTAVVRRELREVPTPWGWPGSQIRGDLTLQIGAKGSATNGSGNLQSWVDRLIAEKRTVDDDEYLLRKDASLRALLEDRFGRSVRPGEVAYQPVKPPRLRDPDRPYDQMDNFPSGKAEQIVSRLQSEPKRAGGAASATAARRSRDALREVRTPWGW